MNETLEYIKSELPKSFRGDIAYDDATLTRYSHDASLLEVRPLVVVYPKDAEDVKSVVRFVLKNKSAYPTLSVTPRAAGTCMAGGSLNESIILDVSKYMQGVLNVSESEAKVLPGTFYRDFEVETLKKGAILPCYTASKNLCALGGMIANNCAGEKTLKYGKMENYVKELKVVLRDGNEYTVKPLTGAELDQKMSQRNVEGELYRGLYDIITKNSDLIKSAKPKVSKNSAGYYLWNVWDGTTFDLTRLIVGSEGTLGIVTEATLKLVPITKFSKLFVVLMPNISKLGEVVNEILAFKPESIESYDDSTMKFALKFLPEMFKVMKSGSFFKMMWQFIPEAIMSITGGIPKLILLVEFTGNDEKEINSQMEALQAKIKHFKFKTRIARTEADSEKYWTIRRESFNLLRKHVRGRRTAPFIDDVVVLPEFMPEFLPKMRAILDEYKLLYTIAGHAGNGNFHIIPLMDMKDDKNVDAIFEVSDKVYDLVLSYKGSITGEHNDGLIRTPYIEKMYGSKVYDLFKKTKELFDPTNMFNPNKKVGGSIEYTRNHIARS
jgi:FAD/FMN-containing dehydrogenase